MSLALVDAGGWQNALDLRTGEKVEAATPGAAILRRVLARHPYPGDGDPACDRWVCETALDLVREYEPRLACLILAQHYVAGRFLPLDGAGRRAMRERTFAALGEFLDRSGFTPILVGTGDLVDHAGTLDLGDLDGLPVSGGWSARHAGLHRPSARDLDRLAARPGIERIVPRAEFLALYPDAPPGPGISLDRFPDALLVAKEGWSLSAAGPPGRRILRIPAPAPLAPVASPLGAAATLADVHRLALSGLARGPVALVVLEGIGVRDFPSPFVPCANGRAWFSHEPGEAQLVTLSAGEERIFAHPPGYDRTDEPDRAEFPFSGMYRGIPPGTLGEAAGVRSVAVGNHSMHPHMAFGADLAVECFARNLANQGSLGVALRERPAGG